MTRAEQLIDQAVESFLPPPTTRGRRLPEDEDGGGEESSSSSSSSSEPDYIPASEARELAAALIQDKARLEAFCTRAIKSENGRRLAEHKRALEAEKFNRVEAAIRRRYAALEESAQRLAAKYGFLVETSANMRRMHGQLRAAHASLQRRSVVAEALRAGVPNLPEAERQRAVRALSEVGTREEMVEGIRRLRAKYAQPVVEAPVTEQPREAIAVNGGLPLPPAPALTESNRGRIEAPAGTGGESKGILLFEATRRKGGPLSTWR